MRRSAVQRRGVAVAGVLAVALLAGCSGSESETDGDDVGAAASAEASASAVAGGGASAGSAALSAEGLEAIALVEGQAVAGGTVTAQVSDLDFPNLGTVAAKKTACTALATVQAGSVLGEPASVVRRMWLGPQETSEADLGADPSSEELANAALDATTSFVSLASYEQAAAKAVMADIGQAVKECASGFVYTVAGEDPVETVKAEKRGAPAGTDGADEVIAATLSVAVDGASGPMEVVVVREGGTIGYFPATNLASQATGEAFILPAALVQTQLAQLAEAG